MKTRRHHNNKGIQQCKSGSVVKKLEHIAKMLGIKIIGKETYEVIDGNIQCRDT